ncbi:MAG: hypothetical protein EOO43_22970 [Flavobacterium sp.]|nr:MAG: hypothetical protein EOO43_22970 [Flavobacterium sp.]
MEWSIISPKEKELLAKIEANNDKDISIWRISNIIIPIVTIGVSIVCALLFKKGSWTPISIINLLLTGAIPMIALNRISSMGVYLFKYDRTKEKLYGIEDTFLLRTKLALGLVLLVASAMILYIHQVLNYPFNLDWIIVLILPLSIFSVYTSIHLSKKVYLLQDKLIDNTFDREISEEVKAKGHGQNWKR